MVGERVWNLLLRVLVFDKSFDDMLYLLVGIAILVVPNQPDLEARIRYDNWNIPTLPSHERFLESRVVIDIDHNPYLVVPS